MVCLLIYAKLDFAPGLIVTEITFEIFECHLALYVLGKLLVFADDRLNKSSLMKVP
jgi:hypothetical protein